MTAAQTIDQLEQQFSASEASGDVPLQIASLNALAWTLSDNDMKRAYVLSEAAYELANAPTNGALPDQAGLGYSLRTQGYINQRLGDYPLGLTQLLKAQDIFESHQIGDGLADVLDGLAGIYFQIGDFPEALKLIMQQLEVAQRIGDNRRIANAYNNLSAIYHEMGDYERSIETLQRNLQLAAETDYPRIEFLSCANLAGAYLATGDYGQALQHALRGLRVSQTAGFELFEVHAFDLIGKCYLKLGQAAQAIALLEQALTMTRWLEAKALEAQVLQTLAEVYREMGQLDRTVEYLQESVAVAEAIDEKVVLSIALAVLAQVYEQQGDQAQALVYLKRHNALQERVLGEKATMRLQVLQVAHDTETARKEAEILRLKAQQLELEIDEQKKVEKVLQDARTVLEQQVSRRTSELSHTVELLQQEIAERERAEAETQQVLQTLEQRVADRTEELAAFFDLILLAGQGISLPEVLEQVLPQVTEITRSEAVGIDLLDTERSVLQLVAKQNLPEDIPTLLPLAGLPLEFQRWLQQPNDPLSTPDLATMPALGSIFHAAGLHTYLGAQIRIGSRVEGVLSCFRFTQNGYSVDETALILALAHQIGIILEIDRLREKTETIAVLEERQRLARDLHDSVTQSLYSLALFSHSAREAADDGDTSRLQRSLVELEHNTLHTLREMRLLLYELRPADLEQEGLKRAIELRLNAVEHRANLKLDVRIDELTGLSSNQEVELYHIVVEALNNIVKHSAATSVTVHLTQTAKNLHLQIVDDGQGFDLTQAKGGMGLNNIRERVARLNGRLTISSAPNSGTRLEAMIPYRVEDHR